jgi:hypothetical protein
MVLLMVLRAALVLALARRLLMLDDGRLRLVSRRDGVAVVEEER